MRALIYPLAIAAGALLLARVLPRAGGETELVRQILYGVSLLFALMSVWVIVEATLLQG